MACTEDKQISLPDWNWQFGWVIRLWHTHCLHYFNVQSSGRPVHGNMNAFGKYLGSLFGAQNTSRWYGQRDFIWTFWLLHACFERFPKMKLKNLGKNSQHDTLPVYKLNEPTIRHRLRVSGRGMLLMHKETTLWRRDAWTISWTATLYWLVGYGHLCWLVQVLLLPWACTILACSTTPLFATPMDGRMDG